MCGILGHFGKISEAAFKKSLDTISHRGPDGWGIWNNDDMTLGHRRLSIIDLSERGKQPMEVMNRYVITFNGEIYNYKEIRSELEKKGISFFSDSDTEVLLNSYMVWGKKCVNYFNGMWAFAIWDKIEKQLFLSRDRVGKKPLFYIQKNGVFAFASEMKALYPLLDEVQVNEELVGKAKSNVFCYESSDDCLIKGIYRFPAATNGFFSNGKLFLEKYWDVLDDLTEVPKSYEEQTEQFRELFIDACRLRMRSDVTIGTALSGGLDSSATISTMSYVAKHIKSDFNRDWQHAFVATFPGSFLDESTYAKSVVDNININATYLTIDPLKDIENLSYYTYLFEELYLTSPIPFIQLYKEIKRNGTTVTIDGHGSDELFGGYPFDIITKVSDDFPNPLKVHETVKTYLDGVGQSGSFLSNMRHSLYHFRQQFKLHENKNNSPLDALGNRLYESTFRTVLPTLLRNYDRYSMINGVEIRMPFLDHRIVSLAFSLPSAAKVRNGYTKAIVRDAMKGLVPELVLQRKDKIGFNSPFADWIRGSLKPWILDTISSQSFKQSNFILPEEVRKLVKEVIDSPRADFELGERAWKAIMPYFWEQSLKHIPYVGSDSVVRL